MYATSNFIVWNEERQYLGSMPQALYAIWDRETTSSTRGVPLQKCANAHAKYQIGVKVLVSMTWILENMHG